jgi:hypothetical protein
VDRPNIRAAADWFIVDYAELETSMRMFKVCLCFDRVELGCRRSLTARHGSKLRGPLVSSSGGGRAPGRSRKLHPQHPSPVPQVRTLATVAAVCAAACSTAFMPSKIAGLVHLSAFVLWLGERGSTSWSTKKTCSLVNTSLALLTLCTLADLDSGWNGARESYAGKYRY